MHTCHEALVAVDAGYATCEDVRGSDCSCCGFCDAEAQYEQYTDCVSGDPYCNYCKQSEYAGQPIFDYTCPGAALSHVAAICISFFTGFFGGGYFYYGYIGLGCALFFLFGVTLTIGIVVSVTCKHPAGMAIPFVGACSGMCWGFAIFIMIVIPNFFPNTNKYEVRCPIACAW